MPSTRQEQRAAKRPVTVPFSKTMHWPGQRLGGESAISRQVPGLKDRYTRRGLANPQARALLAKYGELWKAADLELEFLEQVERRRLKTVRTKAVA